MQGNATNKPAAARNSRRSIFGVDRLIAISAVLVGLVAAGAAVAVIPESRCWARLDTCPAGATLAPVFPPQIPFQSGWIFVGYHNGGEWIEGPMAKVIYRANKGKGVEIPDVGDVLRVTKSRRIIIAEFKTMGLANQMTDPGFIKGTIDSNDETGVELAKGALVLARDVQLGAYPGRAAAVWCRVAACEPEIPQCVAALQTAKVSP